MRNWYYFNWLCGDHIVEQHIHNLDVINWLKGGYPVRAKGMGGRQVRTGDDYGEIFDHHAVEFEYADGSRMFSYCRHIPNCWDSVSEHAHGTKGVADISGHRIEPKEWRRLALSRRQRRTRTRSSTTTCSPASAPAARTTKAEYGALSTMTAIFGRMATYSGKMISWDEALNSQISLAPEAVCLGRCGSDSRDCRSRSHSGGLNHPARRCQHSVAANGARRRRRHGVLGVFFNVGRPSCVAELVRVLALKPRPRTDFSRSLLRASELSAFVKGPVT